MAFNLAGWVYISKKEKEFLSEGEVEFILAHERAHTKYLYMPKFTQQQKWRVERLAQKQAINELINMGYTREELFIFELRYRIYEKYGLSLSEYLKL